MSFTNNLIGIPSPSHPASNQVVSAIDWFGNSPFSNARFKKCNESLLKRTSRENHFLVYFESENSAKTFGVVCFIDVEKPSMSIGREYQLPFAGHVNQQPAKRNR